MRSLSIITCVCNNLAGLKRTAASVLAQTNRDFEWIVIDGGSTDGSRDYIERELVAHVSYWCSEPDGGVYFGINKGIAHAHGEYVICMNSGDVFADSDVIAYVMRHAPDADVVYGDWNLLLPTGTRFVHLTDHADLEFFYLDNLCHQAMFVRTQLLKDSPFDTNYRIYADWVKWRELAARSKIFGYLPKTICNFDAVDVGLSRRDSEIARRERILRDDAVPGSWLVPRLKNAQSQVHELNQRLSLSERGRKSCMTELEEVRRSHSYRIGRLITMPFRVLFRRG